MPNIDFNKIERLRAEWQEVIDNCDKVVPKLYEILTKKDKDFPLCDSDSEGKKFIRQLGKFMEVYDSLEVEESPNRVELETLGKMHSEVMNVKPEHYGIYGKAIPEAIRAALDTQWNLELRDTWHRFWEEVSSLMIAGPRLSDTF